MEPDMKLLKPTSRTPQYDYGLALRRAVSWLGERYLLAEPVLRRAEARTVFFAEPRSWHDPRCIGPGIRRH
jgi:hypothetical protein